MAPSAETSSRRRDLARMRGLATGLLAALAALFLLTRLAPAGWVWPAYVGAFAEAGMVGACADWFAVTALFRRPFGLPIPHTGIIPRNKDRIGQALGEFIAGNFLTPGVLDARLRRLEPARRLADLLNGTPGSPAVAPLMARRLAGALAGLVSGEAVRGLVEEILRRALADRPLSPLAGRILGWLWRDPGMQRWLDRGLESLATYLDGQEAFIQTQVAGASWRWMPKWLDRMLAEKFTGGLLGAARGLRDPAHPWRAELDVAVEDLIRRLASDPDYLARGEAFKARILADAALPGKLDAIWAAAGQRLGADPAAREALIAEVVERGLRALGQWLAEDAQARAGLDRWAGVIARRALSAQRHVIGDFVAQVVAGWDARAVADRLELQVGRDLQYIRINGALVGGVVGLAIFTLTRWLSPGG